MYKIIKYFINNYFLVPKKVHFCKHYHNIFQNIDHVRIIFKYIFYFTFIHI